MTDTSYFPAQAPASFSDAPAVRAWFAATLADLGPTAQTAAGGDLAAPTPCSDYRLADLLDHVLGWVDFFGHAFADPTGAGTRPDPAAYRMADDPRDPAAVVADAAARFDAALAGGVLDGRVLMSQSQMDGPAAAAMVLGEYLVHGWDLARASGRAWTPGPQACDAAHAFFTGIITPEYRGPAGFFADEIAVAEDSSPLDRLLGFAGRDPQWTATHH